MFVANGDMNDKKIAIISSSEFKDKDLLVGLLNKNKHQMKMLVCDDSDTASLIQAWATDYGVPFAVFPAATHNPDTGEFDAGAIFRRNRAMMDFCDVLVAFFNGNPESGTAKTIAMARELKKPVKTIEIKKNE